MSTIKRSEDLDADEITSSDVCKTIKALKDAVPLGEHPDPHAEWIQVRLDFVNKAVEQLGGLLDANDWLEHGVQEWRDQATREARESRRVAATLRSAIRHLDAILNGARTASESWDAEHAARDWLLSIGNDGES